MSDPLTNLKLLQWPEATTDPFLQIPKQQPIVESDPEVGNWRRLEHHRERAIWWTTAHKLRHIPVWLMVSNSIIWNLSNTRVPYVGGSMTAWHWGVAVGFGQRRDITFLALWCTEMYDKWKLVLAAGASFFVTHQAVYRREFHTNQSLRFWKAICDDLSNYLTHRWENGWLQCEEKELLELAKEIKEAKSPRYRLPEIAADVLATVRFLQHPKVAKARETFAKEIPKSLTDSLNLIKKKKIECETRKVVGERDDKICKLMKQRRKVLQSQGNLFAAFDAYNQKQPFTEEELKPIYALEWPGQVTLDYELLFLLATKRTAKWQSSEKIKELKAGTLPPCKFYEWALEKAGGAATDPVRGRLADPIQDVLKSFGH